MDDSIFPIEDSMIPLQHGNIKDARYTCLLSNLFKDILTNLD